MNTSRIRDLAKQQGKSVTYICKLINRPTYYLNDVLLSAYPNPTLCGEWCSFKPKDTPYLNR